MGNTSSDYSNFVRYTLKSDTHINSIELENEPIGWSDDDLELKRHNQYHGIFYTFTNSLKFIGEAKAYIISAYELGGINTNLYLSKEILKNVDGDIKFVSRYLALADFNTMTEKDNYVTVNFNDNQLAEIIKSHQSDTFEIERETSIDGENIGEALLNKTEIKGRRINVVEESVFNTTKYSDDGIATHHFTPLTTLVSNIQSRHSAVVDFDVDEEDVFGTGAENMFYDNTEIIANDSNVKVKYSLNFSIENAQRFLTVYLKKFSFDNDTGIYTEESSLEVVFDDWEGVYKSAEYSVQGIYEDTIKSNEALMMEFRIGGSYDSFKFSESIKSNLIIEEEVFYDSSPSIDFMFTHDLGDRLMQILTGRKDAFYSKLLGRTDLTDSKGKQIYAKDGEWGLIGNLHGFWVRGFKKGTEKYKSLQTSLKDYLESLKAVANVGISIETINFKERLRVEDLRYYYGKQVSVKLPNQVTGVERKIDSKLFFSGLEFGYEDSGDYSNEMGLDEPNTRTDFVTPIRKSSNKYSKISKYSSEEYELERLRRMPQVLFPNEETRSDDRIWFKDLKRPTDGGLNYIETEPEDRLNPLPDTGEYANGVYSPETYRSMFFTPLRMLFRHAWVFRAGLEKYLDKYIRYISSDSNSGLELWFKGEDKPYKESTDLIVSELQRSSHLPKIIKFNHQVDDELMDLITGTTRIEYPNGSGIFEDVPNYYFKFEWINEKGSIERGYLLELKPNGKGEFTFQSVNENLI